MKFEFDIKTGRLYVSKNLAIILVATIILAVLIAGYFLFSVFTSDKKLVTPEEELTPIAKLGLSQEDATDSGKIAQALYKDMQKEHQNTLPIIFFYDGYLDQKQAVKDIDVLKEALKVVEPFKSSPELLSFKTLTTNGQRCRVEGGVKVLVCDRELIESFRKLGIENIKIVIISPLEFVSAAQSARGSNSWMAISTHKGTLEEGSFKRWLGVIFMQNLGKSLGLKNEFEKAEQVLAGEESKDLKSAKPNCAPSKQTAENWWGDYVVNEASTSAIGYFSGCAGGKEYIYPEKGTLMSNNPEKESYGKVSEDYLRGVLYCFYGNKEDIIFPAGRRDIPEIYKNCEKFKKEYPNFWRE